MQPIDLAGSRRRATLLVLYRSLSDIAAKSVMFVITVAAARRLSRDDFGLFAIASTLGWLVAIAGDFGIQVHLARAVSQNRDRSAALLQRWVPVRLVTGAVALGLGLALAAVVDLGSNAFVPIVLFTLAYAATGLCECLYYFFRGHDRTDLESTLTLIGRVSLAAMALAVLWRQPRLDLLGLAMLTSSLLTLLAAAALARRLGRGQLRPAAERGRGREFAASVAPIGVGILLSALYFRTDVFLVERWSGAGAVGLYNAVFRLIDALRLFPAAVIAVALPALCRATDMRILIRLAAPLIVSAAAAALIVWPAAGWLVPAIYGDSYRDAVPLLRVLLLAVPPMFLNYALTHQLIGWHQHHAYAVICAVALVGNLLLNALLIPRIGPAGAAWATVWTEAIVTAGCIAALARHMTGVGSEGRTTGATIGAAR